jgi:hypothetical protein
LLEALCCASGTGCEWHDVIAILAISLEGGVLVSDPPVTPPVTTKAKTWGKGSEIGVVPETATTMN